MFYIFYVAYPKYLPNPPLFFGGRVTRVTSDTFVLHTLKRCAPEIWEKLHKFCCTQKSAQPKKISSLGNADGQGMDGSAMEVEQFDERGQETPSGVLQHHAGVPQ